MSDFLNLIKILMTICNISVIAGSVSPFTFNKHKSDTPIIIVAISLSLLALLVVPSYNSGALKPSVSRIRRNP